MSQPKYIVIDDIGFVHHFFSIEEALIAINKYHWSDYEIAKIVDSDELVKMGLLKEIK